MIKKLQQQFEKYPEIQIMYINKLDNESWTSWKNYNECSEEEKIQANLRQIFPNEIVLDLEEEHKLPFIKKLLSIKELKYYMYKTGSRGIHVHLYYDNLEELHIVERNAIRKKIIQEFQCDETKSNEKTLIAIIDKPHFKTKRNKEFLEEDKGINTLSQGTIKAVRTQLENQLRNREELSRELEEAFKNFKDKDPFFQYFKKVKITNSQRNNIVFKNLAVGLCKSGLNYEQIKNLVEPIIKENCTGKHVNEFMGWVEKYFEGQLDFYNIYEINQWSKLHNHPIFYKEIENQEELITQLSTKQLWDLYWKENVIGNEEWRDLLYYSMLGVILDEEDKDYRVHLTIIATTTSGKDLGINLMQKVLDKLTIKNQSINAVTDAGIIGSFNEEINNFNKKKGVEEGQENYRDPVTRGALFDCKLLAFPEAEIIFKPSLHSKHIQGSLRSAMDEKRVVTKRMAQGEIEYNTNATVIFATYPEVYIVKDILKNGLFQRVLMLYKNISEVEQMKIFEFTINKQINYQSLVKSSIYEEELVRRLKPLWEYWNNNKSKILEELGKILDNKHIINLMKKIMFNYSFLDLEETQLLTAMVIRNSKKLIAIITMNYLMKLYDEKLGIKKLNLDISSITQNVLKLYEGTMKSISLLVFHSKGRSNIIKALDKRENAILNFMKHKNGEATTQELNDYMDENIEGAKSNNSKTKILKNLEEAKLIASRFENRQKVYMLTDIDEDI